MNQQSGKATISMVDADFEYTYEYLGIAPIFFHTLLTDKCYLTLTQGMRVGLGGNPYGPAGNLTFLKRLNNSCKIINRCISCLYFNIN